MAPLMDARADPKRPVRAIFVLGSPRTGTTMLGNYLGSAASVCNTGEYRALYLAYGALPFQLGGQLGGQVGGLVLTPPGWEAAQTRYAHEVQRHAVEFVTRTAREMGKSSFCDSSPRNLLIAGKLAELFPDALFVLALRHYSGTIQSLLRLGSIRLLPGNEPGIDWFNPTAVAAAAVWSRHYQSAAALPPERTVAFGYDAFCAEPAPVLARFKVALAEHGFPVDELDDSVFAVSHATLPGQARVTVGTARTGLAPIPSYDAESWTALLEADVRPVVQVTDEVLRLSYPDDYREPAGYPGSEDPRAAGQAAPGPSPRAAVGAPPAAERSARRSAPGARPAAGEPPAAPPPPGGHRSARGPRAGGS
jgi:hypothetical protein